VHPAAIILAWAYSWQIYQRSPLGLHSANYGVSRHAISNIVVHCRAFIALRFAVTALDTVQPVAPLADDLRGSTISQGSVFRPNVIDGSDRDRSVTGMQ